MNELEKIRAWDWLKKGISKIYDLKTRQMYYKAFLARAIGDYGFNPENPAYGQKNNVYVDLDDWGKGFVEDITDSITFGFNVRKHKQEQEFIFLRRNLRQMVRNFEELSSVPEDVINWSLQKQYITELINECEDTIDLADSVINKGE